MALARSGSPQRSTGCASAARRRPPGPDAGALQRRQGQPAGRRGHLLRVPVVLPDPGARLLRGRARSPRSTPTPRTTWSRPINDVLPGMVGRGGQARSRSARSRTPRPRSVCIGLVRRCSTPAWAGCRRCAAPCSWCSSSPPTEQPELRGRQAARPVSLVLSAWCCWSASALAGVVTGFSDRRPRLVGLESDARLAGPADRPGARVRRQHRCSSSRSSSCWRDPTTPQPVAVVGRPARRGRLRGAQAALVPAAVRRPRASPPSRPSGSR